MIMLKLVIRHLQNINRLELKSGIDGHPESPQVGHSRPANTSQHLNSVYVVTSCDKEMQ